MLSRYDTLVFSPNQVQRIQVDVGCTLHEMETMQSNQCRKLTPGEIAAKIPAPNGDRFFVALERGELQIELYMPGKVDDQTPHRRDECYVIVEGTGNFEMDGEIVPFEAGDFFFVPAGVEHRFLDYGASMKTWVIFYGPDGGEQV